MKKTKSWTEVKDKVYGRKGTERRDALEREAETFKIGLLLRTAREKKTFNSGGAGRISS